MPYTPPAQRSPASSLPTSPDLSRRSSFQQGPHNSPRPQLPRSASYLTRHRRTPSAVGAGNDHADILTPQDTCDDLKAMVMNSSSIRQSPPPVTGDRGMPSGAVISPPESSSDEEDLPEVRGRKIENLRELHDAISQIPQHRESSPSKGGSRAVGGASDAGDLLMLRSQAAPVISEGMHRSFTTGSLDELAGAHRRISHSRSATEPVVGAGKSAGSSLTGSEEDSDDDDFSQKPQMVRKKSGELVRPALRPASRRRPSSMPGTPTFSKAVHFDSHLEHVRHFLQVDRPLAVSAGSSPVDNYESDNEYPFPGEDKSTYRTPPFEWEIIMSNFPVETPARKSQSVRLERVWLSPDQKCLIGSVIVTNLAYQKYVTCRFTLDYWKTTSEVAAEYVTEVRPMDGPISQDRFQFTIKLSDLANLESKTLYFCIRYNVNGQELWDNNGGTNFQADFRKKMQPQNGKKGTIGAASRPANGLPRSNRRPTAASVPRPKPESDEFGNHAKVDFGQSIQEYLGETGPLRLKGVRSSVNLPSDNLSSRLSAPSGQAFANRYDFSASLNAAVQAAKDATTGKPDGLQMKLGRKPTGPVLNTSDAVLRANDQTNKAAASTNNAVAPTTQGTESAAASIASSSYEELVNKYCFFGTKQTSPQLRDGTQKGRTFDGANDGSTTRGSNSSDSSASGSPVMMARDVRSMRSAQHHSLHPKDPNPYFQHAVSLTPVGASPAESPMQGFALQQRRDSPVLLAPPRPKASSSPGRSSSPAMMANLHPYAGTSPNEFAYQQLHDRFPFSGTEAHAATAIRG